MNSVYVLVSFNDGPQSAYLTYESAQRVAKDVLSDWEVNPEDWKEYFEIRKVNFFV